MTPDPDYPRFSPNEFSRRLGLVRRLMSQSDVNALIVCGSARRGAEIQYLTNWIVQNEGILVVPAVGPLTLYVQHFNHVPNAQRISVVPRTVWAGPNSATTVAQHLGRHFKTSARIGIIGPLGYLDYQVLQGHLAKMQFIDLTAAFVQLRLRKSREELEWLQRAAGISDQGILSIVQQARSGISEHDLVGIVDMAHRAAGGSTQIAFLASTSMIDPHVFVPAQHASGRVLRPGDVVVAEISGQYWGYSGQVLRTFTIESDPTPAYLSLHEVATEVFSRVCDMIRPGATTQDIAATAADMIRGHGYELCDDLVHGYGGGYLPPIIRWDDIANDRVRPFVFDEDMVVVVQPNIISPTHRMGVQIGEMVRVTETGIDRMHHVPLELFRCG